MLEVCLDVGFWRFGLMLWTRGWWDVGSVGYDCVVGYGVLEVCMLEVCLEVWMLGFGSLASCRGHRDIVDTGLFVESVGRGFFISIWDFPCGFYPGA